MTRHLHGLKVTPPPTERLNSRGSRRNGLHHQNAGSAAPVQFFVRRSSMATVVVQIGNSDNKLSQVEWSQFVSYVRDAIGEHSEHIHFDGGARHDAPWQNACFVSEVSSDNQERLMVDIRSHREMFRQDSVAVTIGETAFV